MSIELIFLTFSMKALLIYFRVSYSYCILLSFPYSITKLTKIFGKMVPLWFLNQIKATVLQCKNHVGLNLYCVCAQCCQSKLKLLPSVCMGVRGTMSMGRSRAGEVGESSSHTEHGQSVYLALCSVGTPSSRLFHGPPYLSHALLLLPLPPPVRMPSLGSLQAHTHTYTHSSLLAHGWVCPRATRECWYQHRIKL